MNNEGLFENVEDQKSANRSNALATLLLINTITPATAKTIFVSDVAGLLLTSMSTASNTHGIKSLTKGVDLHIIHNNDLKVHANNVKILLLLSKVLQCSFTDLDVE